MIKSSNLTIYKEYLKMKSKKLKKISKIKNKFTLKNSQNRVGI